MTTACLISAAATFARAGTSESLPEPPPAAPAAAPWTVPHLTTAHVDWPAAVRALAVNATLAAQALHPIVRPPRRGEPARAPAPLARLNAAMATRFPGVERSPIPVLLPFNTDLWLLDIDAGRALPGDAATGRYQEGVEAAPFFHPGPSGYDSIVVLRGTQAPALRDVRYPEPFQILISGSLLLYELPDQRVAEGDPVPDLEPDFPGIRRLLHEHHLRYTFMRFGVPYVVSIACFDAGVSRYRMPACRDADRALRHVLGALRVVGGMPQPPRTLEAAPIRRPAAASETFSFHPPGAILPGTGFRGHAGRADRNVYAQIRFPMLEAPAYVNSQLFQRRNRPAAPGQSANHSYPWRDSFCERRGFAVGQCPAGHGHQGQDLRPPLCEDGQYRCRPNDLVAVRDGALMRSPGQEALYLFVNTETEHLRFRYLHMDPRRLDAEGVWSGRLVREGEVVGQMSNFSRRPAGTSYHLHFDIQVPTRHGWVFVNPYMTLVAAYERLIDGRGTEVPNLTPASAEPERAAIGGSKRAKPAKAQRDRAKRRGLSSRRQATRPAGSHRRHRR